VGHNVEEILQPAFKLRNAMLVASLVLIGLGIIIALLISHSIRQPLGKLCRGAEIIGKGDLEHRVEIRTKDEIGELAVAFNQMVERRKQAEEELKKYRDHLEELVENRTSKLEELNTELEAFAYSVSHDLRAPLRAVQGFSQALLEDYAPKLDAQGKDYARRMDDSARRMETLIQDLLEYSRLSRSEIQLKPVDLTSVVEHVLTQLGGEIKEKDALIRVDAPLPKVLGHSATLEQVVENLIANAIKFVSPGVKPKIHLWAEEGDTVVRLWVEDNGIGIAPEHHERIFRIFERLHGIETYPGTGIGLATVKKGLEKMAGTVGVESVLGKGSRFWIELPRKEEQ
jgi:signal transduction histidine kinase